MNPWSDRSHLHWQSPSKDRDPGGAPGGVATRLRKREDTAHGGKRHELLRVPLGQLPNFLFLSGATPALPLGTPPQLHARAQAEQSPLVFAVGKQRSSLSARRDCGM